MDDEGEMTVKVAKKQRANSSEEKTSTAEPEPTRRGGRTRRSQRSRQEEEANEKTKPSVKAAPIPHEDDSVVVIDDLLLGDDAEKKGNKLCDLNNLVYIVTISMNFGINKQYFIQLGHNNDIR